MDNITAIILAAGKGTRMNSKDVNKVALPIHGKPMILRTIKVLEDSGVNSFIVVVGYAKESVIGLLKKDIITVEQKDQLGTGHAVECALPKVDIDSKNVLIIYGDDSFLYDPQTFVNLLDTHIKSNAKITFISMDANNPTGFGRIIRDKNGEITGIVEEKNATDNQRKIKEINLGCYIIDKNYLKKNIRQIKKNEITREFYITDIIDIVARQGGKIASYNLTDGIWKGVNTPDDLAEAESLFANVSK